MSDDKSDPTAAPNPAATPAATAQPAAPSAEPAAPATEWTAAPAASVDPAAAAAVASTAAATPAPAADSDPVLIPILNPDASNRRQSFRIAINTPVVVEYSGGVIDAQGADFSDSCMLVLSDTAPHVDAEVTLRCTDDAGKLVTMHGRVLRHHTPDGVLKGFVVQEKH